MSLLESEECQSMKKEHNITIDPAKCTACGRCRDDCPDNVLIITEKSAEYTGQFCVKCGHCVAICPQGAVSMSGYDDEPEAIAGSKKVDPDDFLRLIKARRSMRQFTEKDVPPELISQIIEAGRYTPTGGNKQGVSYVVIREIKDEYEKIALSELRRLQPSMAKVNPYIKNVTIGDDFLFKGAPVAIVIKSIDLLDGALAASTMELMAQSLGLGVLYSGFFTYMVRQLDELKQKLSVEQGEEVVTTLVIGYPAAQYQRTAQRESANVTYR